MIIGIGTDIVQIDRIGRAFSLRPEKFMQKILAAEEIEKMPLSREIEYLAKRFAAKEAISKALGSGMRLGVRFRDILILSDLETGQPLVQLRGRAKQQASEKGINRILISISDEKEYAMAFAMGLSF
ncbi:MAG: holo-ACP synthase [Gammaproteobacteria bacterium]|nr:holo-ACP synthase [Gammaproteobacteria bacterium]|tara:strand:- start:320 stop:700 length:381 start_codon:yes stop_codon:yes gene_type:complete